MDRASQRHMGNVDRMRRFGIRPVDFVRAAERGSAVGAGIRLAAQLSRRRPLADRADSGRLII